jgi:hypothetical protein
MERLTTTDVWQTVERPGYLGKKKDETFRLWNEKYGEGGWRIVNEMANGEIFSHEDIIWKVYVPGYVAHFLKNPDQAKFITDNYSYTYDKDLVTKEQAFDIYALYNKPGVANQFHNVALNLALEYYLGYQFKGARPLQVREGKPGTPDSEQPEGFMWSPGRILSVRPDLIPAVDLQGAWWGKGSIEDLYQKSKALQIGA